MVLKKTNPGVSTIQQQAQAWVLRMASGQATTRDLQALRAWCATSPEHGQAFELARRAWDDIGQVGRVFRAAHPQRQPQRPRRRAFLGAAFGALGTAAVATMVYPPLGLWPSVFELNSDYRTATGEQRRIDLGGQVNVSLNTQSSLRVQGGQGGDEIELVAGEAAVANADNARVLRIVAGNGRALLGDGEIEVRLIAAQACVTCVRGQVEFQHPARSVTLRAGEQALYDKREVTVVASADAVRVAAWRDGAVVFRDTPLAAAVAEINRYRPGHVVLLDSRLGERKVSGKFRIARLDLAIDRIQEAFGAQVRKLPGGVILLG